jgi:signal transduction histidine kinase
MNLFAFIGLLVGISCVLLSAIAVFFGRTQTHRLLMLFNVACAVWGFGLFLAGIANAEARAIRGWQIANTGGIFIGPLFYHMVSAFRDVINKKVIYLGYSCAIAFSIMIIGTTYVINKTRFVFDIYYMEITPIYIMGVLFYLSFVLLAYFNLVIFRRTTKGYKHIQSSYIVYGFLFGFVGATTSFLPMFRIDILYPFGNIGIVIYCLVLSYAILHHRLLDFKIVIRRSLVYSISLSILVGFFIMLVVGMTKYLSEYAGISHFTITVISSLIIAILFAPVKKRIQLLTDRAFFKTTYDYYETIKKISQELTTTIDFKYACTVIVDNIFDTLKLKSGYILLAKDGFFETIYVRSANEMTSDNSMDTTSAKEYFKEGQRVRILPKDSEICNFIRNGTIIVREELWTLEHQVSARAIADELSPFDGEVVVPIFVEGEVMFLLILGKKLSDGAFTSEDMNLLSTVATQSAIALKNVKLYDEMEELVKQKDHFITRLGHDLKTPITPMLTLLPIIKENETDLKQTELLDVCHQNVMNMKELVIKTLKHARIASSYKKLDIIDIPLRSEVEGYVNRREFLIKQKSLTVENIIDSRIAIKADKVEFEELFYNLISNAIKYSQENGSITINADDKGDIVILSVKDTGIGLTEEQIEHVFDEFFKVDESRHELDSSGLGLSICKKIVKKHGGNIWAESAGKNLGTTIFFTIRKGVSKKEAVL